MIALIAGTGALPAILVARLRADGEVPVMCQLSGFPAEVPDGLPTLLFRLETFGSLLKTLKGMGVTRICLAGAIRRPVIDLGAVDAETRPIVPVLMTALGQGDDGALRAVIGVLEDAGFTMISAHDVATDLIPDSGVLTTATYSSSHVQDAAFAETVVAQMGRADQGQACVVRAGKILAQEDQAGTDAMLDALRAPTSAPSPDPVSWMMDTASDLIGGAADWLSNTSDKAAGHGAILFKAPKPDQDRRADLPVIGPETAVRVVQLGLDGIVVEAGSVMVIELAEICDVLNAAGKFLWVRTHGFASETGTHQRDGQ